MLLETGGKVILAYSSRKIGRIIPIINVGNRPRKSWTWVFKLGDF